ncbi:hypothetical protein, partial [Pseudonocardia sp.]|uniref:hypothetical protein n=1 Tax=Pseudonocardia sp. TaxID=60912 RepID=UPI003D0A6783
MFRKTDSELIDAFNAACRAAGFALPPRVARIEGGHTLVVRLWLGMHIGDLEAAAGRLAAVFGVWSVLIEPINVTESSWVVERLLIEQGDWSDGSTSQVRRGDPCPCGAPLPGPVA